MSNLRIDVAKGVAFVEREEDILRSAVVGDVVRLEGKLVRVVKRTASAVAVVPYRWYHAVADALRRAIARL